LSAGTRPQREADEFATQVNRMFDRIAGVYDRMNSTMTVGLDRRWRERTVDRIEPLEGARVLDVCCGTGDLALELSRRVGDAGSVVGCDFSEPMLDLARQKGAARGAANTRFEWADALELSYDDAGFDAVTVGFGVRNFADLDRGLAELARVLRPGGRLAILEITQPQRPPLSWFFALWFDRIVPVLGSVAGDHDAYTYLPESVKRFPGPPELAAKLDAVGLAEIRYLVLGGGIIAIHTATKPSP
jgi:demethylmenaquinone methyltransferase / 2-methoxy-6-polyprenyl-1,4-benzoquinol methylase